MFLDIPASAVVSLQHATSMTRGQAGERQYWASTGTDRADTPCKVSANASRGPGHPSARVGDRP
jgi:hypothetical protein